MLKSQQNQRINQVFIPSFNEKAFDLKSYEEMALLPQQELLATLLFTFLMQMDNPVSLFGSAPTFLMKGEDLSTTLYVDQDGVVSDSQIRDSIFNITLSINTHLLNASVANVMKENKDANEDDVGTYCIDAFLLQIAPQIWEKSQLLLTKLTEEENHSWLVKTTHYAASSGFTPYSMYADLLVPLIGMIYKTKNKGLN